MARSADQLEAAAYLLAARLAVRTISFRRLVAFFERPIRKPELTGTTRAEARDEVRLAIRRASTRMPGEWVCFPRALAAGEMLRRRGLSTDLYCGASTSPEAGLTAHVWLQDGAVGVTGQRVSQRYHALARYQPSERDVQ